MKRICFALVIACLSVTGTVRAEVWGRVIPNAMIARTQDKTELAPELNKSALQAPIQAPIQAPSAIQAPMQTEGYPFTERCGGSKAGCCANVWDGYTGPGCCGLGRGIFASGFRGGLLGGHGCSTGCATQCDKGCATSCGGVANINSFAGGVVYNGCDCPRGLGWHGCGLHSLAASGKHHLMNLRRACGLGCDAGCTTCGESKGCSSCNGKSHDHLEGGKGMLPPLPPGEPTPMTDKADDVPSAPQGDKSALRSHYSPVRRSPLGF